MTDPRSTLRARILRAIGRWTRDGSMASARRRSDRAQRCRAEGMMDHARDFDRLARKARLRAESLSETLASSMAGPVSCPCGWDDRGELEVRDWWADAYPPGPRPKGGAAFAVVGDAEHGYRLSCPECGDDLAPESMVPREGVGSLYPRGKVVRSARRS